MAIIIQFVGKHDFLSNFYPSPVWFEGVEYSSVEHAFQASKTLDTNIRAEIQSATMPSKAKRRGRAIVTRRPRWDNFKVAIMHDLLQQKFYAPTLRVCLLETNNAILVAGNKWHDNFWGACGCGSCSGGENHLGKLLMHIRTLACKEDSCEDSPS